MKTQYIFKHPISFLKIVIFKVKLFLFRKIICSKDAWQIFDQSNIEGFGTNLIRLYFPIYYTKNTPRESFSAGAKKQFISHLGPSLENNKFDDHIISFIPKILKLHLTDMGDGKPYLDNYFFGVMDAAVLSSMMLIYKPLKIIEIGSGISTKYMKLIKEDFCLNTEIICIDPSPREDITEVADRIITEPLENVVNDFNIQQNDIVFLDGSHYTFQGNDTITFFFNILTSVPDGTIIHIHDIYLPYDYAADVAQQLWTEQYLVAAMFISGFKGFEVLYPAYYSTKMNEKIVQALEHVDYILQARNFKVRRSHKDGFSLWIRKK